MMSGDEFYDDDVTSGVSRDHEDHERYHEWCAGCVSEADASYREAMVGYRGERIYQQAMKLAREDLDMDDATERELSHAILLRLK